MATQEIGVNIGHGRIVTVEAEAKYRGTRTPRHSMGGRNIEDYEVACMGHMVSGTWDCDGRHAVVVEDCPAELRALLLPLWRKQELRRLDAEFYRLTPSDRDYFFHDHMRQREAIMKV